jgi:cell division protein FtsI/penicillin-binding protein 2
MTTVLEGVVQNGSGKEAFLNDLSIAGKTGTAQLYDKQSRRHDPSKHLRLRNGLFNSSGPPF